MTRHGRRTVLAMLGTGLTALAGCAGSGGSDPATTDGRPDGDGGSEAEASGAATATWQAPGGAGGRSQVVAGVTGSGPSPAFEQVWRDDDLNTANNLLGPGGNVYNYDSSSQYGGITVVDPASGDTQWSRGIDDGSDAIGRPLWAGTDTLVCSLGALDTGSGERRWGRVDTDTFRGRTAGPTGLYGLGYDAGESRPLRKRGPEGERRWSVSPEGVASASPTFVAGSRLYARANVDGAFGTLVLDTETGERMAVYEGGRPVAADDQYTYLLGNTGMRAVARDGTVAWRLDDRVYAPVLGENRVYYLVGGDTVVACGKDDGSEAWRRTLDIGNGTRLSGAGDRLYVGGVRRDSEEDSRVLLARSLTLEGEVAWRAEGFVPQFVTGDRVFATVLAGSGVPALAAFRSA
jgi:hypothetical protein